MTIKVLGAVGLTLVLSTHAWAASPPIVDAVKLHDLRQVQALISKGANVNAPEVDGATALHWAVDNDDRPMVDLLLRNKANANATNRYGVSPLMLAVTHGNVLVAQALLDRGADPNAALPEGETILMTAARSGSVPIVKLLLSRGATANGVESWHGQSALMWAASENHGGVVAALVEGGADMNLRSKVLDGMPPLRKTAPDVGQQGIHSTFPRGGMTALHFAARQGSADAIAALAAAGVDLDQKDPDGFTAVIFAILNGHYDIAALLIDQGAGVNTTDSSGRGPLFTVVDMNTFEYSFNRATAKPSGRMDALDLVTYLLAHGANPNARLTDRVLAAKYDTAGNPNLVAGATPLMKAVSTSDVVLTKVLLDAGADPFIRNSQHSTLLHVAVGLNWRRLGGIGPEPDAIAVVKLLLDRGLDLDSYNDLGQTVMHAVAMRGRGGQEDGPNTVESLDLIRFLVSKGARLDAKDKSGRTPTDMAIYMKNVKAEALFRELSTGRTMAAR
jgi:ankyrin repeat protein